MAGDDNFVSRWSRRKAESRDPARAKPEAPAQEAAPPAVAADRPPLPPVESLTPESDFSPFMAPEVDGDLRRQALRTLFTDPHFNTMDMLDVYVDDYSKPDPLPASWLGKLEQLARLGDRPGRDREEAQRREALARAAPGAEPGPASPSAGETPAVEAVAPRPGDTGNDPEPAPVIPARESGESGI